MKVLRHITLPAMAMLWLSGCSTMQTIKTQYPLDHQLAKGEVTTKSAYYEIDSGDDDSIRSLFWVIATEGKKYGANYFSIQYPQELKSAHGAPFTNVDEVLSYCEKNMLGGQRPRCGSLSDQANIAVKFYSGNSQPDLLLWSIDDVLRDKKVDSAKINYEFKVYPRTESDGRKWAIIGSHEVEPNNTDFK